MAQHIFDRINVTKENRFLKTSQHKKQWIEIRKLYIKESKKTMINLNKRNLTQKDLQLIKEKIKKRIIYDRIQRNIKVSVVVSVIVILFFFLIKYLLPA